MELHSNIVIVCGKLQRKSYFLNVLCDSLAKNGVSFSIVELTDELTHKSIFYYVTLFIDQMLKVNTKVKEKKHFNFKDFQDYLKTEKCSLLIDLLGVYTSENIPTISLNYSNAITEIGIRESIKLLDYTKVSVEVVNFNSVETTDSNTFKNVNCVFTNSMWIIKNHKKVTGLLVTYLMTIIANRYSPIKNEVSKYQYLKVSFRELLTYGYHLLYVVLKKIFYSRNNPRKWYLVFRKSSWHNFSYESLNLIENPYGSFLADPFLFEINGDVFCLAEKMDLTQRKKGHIVMALFGMQENYFKWIDAIKEDFHLSFPFIFKFEGDYYMCPETSEISEIRLYKLDISKLTWHFYRTIMRDIKAVDNIIFFKNDLWWLSSSVDLSLTGDYETFNFIWYSDNPIDGNWYQHANNPIYVDSSRARNAGIVTLAGEIYRVSQGQALGVYGKFFNINRILDINPRKYIEIVLDNHSQKFHNKNNASHHLTSFDNLTVFDISLNKKEKKVFLSKNRGVKN